MKGWVVGVMAAATVCAEAAASQRLRGFARVGGDFGGDRVIQFEYSDGSSPDVDAGRGLIVAGGAVLRLAGSAGMGLDLVASAGLKFTTIPPATNQEATWLRFPIEGLLLYRTPVGLRLGGGVAFHLANVLKASGEAANARVEFAANPGFVVHVEYGRKNWAFDLRYTAMTYEISSGGSGEVNANSIGGGATFFFGRKGQ
jgi:hypothetical protein